LDDETTPAHSVPRPGAEQVHRNARGDAAADATAAGVVPGAGANAGSAPIVEKGCG
jgi:hypothetical protein